MAHPRSMLSTPSCSQGAKGAIATLVIGLALAPAGAAAQDRYVFRVPIEGPITVQTVRVVRQAVEAAEEDGGVAILLDLASRSERMDGAQLIVDAIEGTPVSVYALVRRAWDASALVALAADSVFMAPGSSIGAGEGRWDLSAAALRGTRAAFQGVAEGHGRDGALAVAMVDPGDDAGRLRLSAADAQRTGIAAGSVTDVAGLLAVLELEDAQVVTAEVAWITTTVTVANRNWSDVRVYIQRSGSRFRLGTVTSNRTATFEIPPGQLGEGGFLRVTAELIGSSDRISTEDVRIQPGLVIEWNIENVLQHSNMTFYVRY